jgi:hypothetical protein
MKKFKIWWYHNFGCYDTDLYILNKVLEGCDKEKLNIVTLKKLQNLFPKIIIDVRTDINKEVLVKLRFKEKYKFFFENNFFGIAKLLNFTV